MLKVSNPIKELLVSVLKEPDPEETSQLISRVDFIACIQLDGSRRKEPEIGVAECGIGDRFKDRTPQMICPNYGGKITVLNKGSRIEYHICNFRPLNSYRRHEEET